MVHRATFVPIEQWGGPGELAGWSSESPAPKLTAPVGMEWETSGGRRRQSQALKAKTAHVRTWDKP